MWGGTESFWENTGLEENVTLLNLFFSSDKQNKFTYIECDACNMAIFKDKEFDIIFSNSVIEHVGDFARQKLFAEEVQRVGKKYWVQTPYKHFPIEPHFVFPLFQYLPNNFQKIVGLNWKQSHFKMGSVPDERILEEIEQLRLLNQKEMKKLFNDGTIMKEKYFGLVKSIIAIKK